MNRFRTKKKAKEAKEETLASRPYHETEQSSLPSFKGFRRAKKSSEEPKKEIDLTAALPTNDDFRTSLLMTNLSARFSMLREQDDPSTKIGKASDDSVLLPKRQSRLADFGFAGGLSDIAEVESIKAPAFSRMNSYVSDDADSTKGGSVMSRGKPTEGNNLFGGRQKIYKITSTGSGTKNGTGMGGRALYEDDVAQSAFQLWRQAEKRGRASEVDADYNEDEAEPRRSESPGPLGYNQRRETSSTMSSASAVARNSTAATSITSQPPALSIKDLQSNSNPPSAATTPVLERNVTRTRRLYEQGLTQDLHDQQSSALSRIDTLARQRNLGNRTPDLVRNSPSPTTFAFNNDRFSNDRRPVLAKASAPNLRSMSPPTTGSSLGGTATLPETKTSLPGSPPLSPPISETGEHPLLAIQPNDRGKATAMGVFQKPVQPYDESKYAQRQLLRQGRETPTQRLRGESNASFATGRSRSSSSVQRQPLGAVPTSAPKLDLKPQEPLASLTFLDDSDDGPPSAELPKIETPQTLNRPSDKDHPAFRESSLPTPLSMDSHVSSEPSPVSENPDASNANSHQVSPVDSPTLGPTVGAGLSGMVRQHLRGDSNASSVYDNPPPTAGFDSRFPTDNTPEDMIREGLEGKSNPWMASDQDWQQLTDDPTARDSLEAPGTHGEKDVSFDSSTRNSSSNEMENEPDEFASQLANARRRVRERLTSYVESDSSQAPSPLLQPESPQVPLNQIPATNPLGIGILKPKSSRGSLIDRSRNIVGSQSKAMKMLGIAGPTSGTSPNPGKQAFEDKDASPLATMEEEPAKEALQESPAAAKEDDEASTPAERTSNDDDDNSNTHPGLRAFRQARRELQKRKELETLARHQASKNTSQGPPQRDEQPSEGRSTPVTERGGSQQHPSWEYKAPPRPQRAPSEESGRGFRGNSNPASRQASTERNRSGSEASGGSSGNRPARLRGNSNAYDDQNGLRPNGGPRPPMMRSPGLPGTDIRRSPIMPPQPYPGSNSVSPIPSPGYFDRAPGNLAPGSNRGYDSHSGPSSPHDASMGLPPSYGMTNGGSGRTTPTAASAPGGRSRRPSAPQSPAFSTTTSTLNDSMRRVVKKDDISEPTFIMSTSRVPTVNLPYSASSPDKVGDSRSRSASGSRDRSNSNTGVNAPPLPPINPRRKWEGSRARGMFGPFIGRKGDADDSQATSSSPHLPLGMPSPGEESRGAFSASEDEDGSRLDQRRRLRKVTGESQVPAPRAPAGWERSPNPPMVVAGPPASRTVVTPGMRQSSNGAMPGGMI